MTDVKQLITEHLDIWLTAETEKKSGRGRSSGTKSSIYGIRKLRQLIMDLAIQGKLVKANPTDSNVEVLIDNIKNHKRTFLADNKKIKETVSRKIDFNDLPFLIPTHWAWVRFSEVTINRDAERIPLSTTVREQRKGSFDYYGASGVIDYVDDYLFDKTLLLIGEDGANLLSRSTPIAFFATGKYWVNNHAHVIDGYSEDFLNYLKLFINAIDLSPYVTGTAQPKMNQAKMNDILVALPPLEEQQRIVAKVDELMQLCDQLEQQQTLSTEAHEQLVDLLLNALTNSADADEFQQNWQRISANFDLLFTTDYSIEQLKQTVLQLAVMGKLVKQDPSDEPASELLKQIAEEKAKLVKEGKIKKSKPLPEITDDEKPFELPSGWAWTPLENISSLITKGSSPKWQGVNYVNEGILFITSENVGSYSLILDNLKYVEEKFNQIEPRSILEKNDFLMNIVGGSIGRTAIYDLDEVSNINQAVCLIRLFLEYLDKEFILHFFNSQICKYYMFDKQVDNARPNLSMGNIAKFIIPIPPMLEQKRIVGKVNQLFSIIDQLRVLQAKARQTQLHLADVLVANAVEGA